MRASITLSSRAERTKPYPTERSAVDRIGPAMIEIRLPWFLVRPDGPEVRFATSTVGRQRRTKTMNRPGLPLAPANDSYDRAEPPPLRRTRPGSIKSMMSQRTGGTDGHNAPGTAGRPGHQQTEGCGIEHELPTDEAADRSPPERGRYRWSAHVGPGECQAPIVGGRDRHGRCRVADSDQPSTPHGLVPVGARRLGLDCARGLGSPRSADSAPLTRRRLRGHAPHALPVATQNWVGAPVGNLIAGGRLVSRRPVARTATGIATGPGAAIFLTRSAGRTTRPG